MIFTFDCVVAVEKMDAGSPVKLSSNVQKVEECYNDIPLKEELLESHKQEDESCDDALLYEKNDKGGKKYVAEKERGPQR